MLKRITVVLAMWAAMLLCSVSSLAAEGPGATPAGEHGQRETAAAVEAAGGHEAPGELIPVSEDAMNKALIQAIWVLIIFAILLVILYPTAWKGVLHGLKTREQRIRKEIADAEAARLKAEQTLADYNRQLATAEDRVRELLAKAQADGERLAANIRDNAGREAETLKGKALTDIEDARKSAVAQVQAEAAEISTAIAEKIIRRNLSVEDQRELVRSSLEQLESSGRN